jgi:hypothetical protein
MENYCSLENISSLTLGSLIRPASCTQIEQITRDSNVKDLSVYINKVVLINDTISLLNTGCLSKLNSVHITVHYGNDHPDYEFKDWQKPINKSGLTYKTFPPYVDIFDCRYDRLSFRVDDHKVYLNRDKYRTDPDDEEEEILF